MTDAESLDLPSESTFPRAPPASWLAGLRPTEADIHPMFIERWSPRAFSEQPVSREALRSIFEAARWAPSSANEQPWLFVYATSPEDRARFARALMPMNRTWAELAPVLVFLFARKKFTQVGPFRGSPNPMAQFDAGSAWMSLAAQAHLLGISTHAMGGIDRAEALRLLGVPADEYEAVIAIAIGHRAAPSSLPEPLAAREVPSPRRPLSEVAVEGKFGPIP
jgi:nitroreductase